MIARTWRGWTAADTADLYERHLNEAVIPGYVSAPGNLGAYVLRRPSADGVEFMILGLWDSAELADAALASVSPDEPRYLVGRETIAKQWEAAA